MVTSIYGKDYRVRIDTIEVSDLDVVFDITRDTTKAPNTANITVYNLSSEHRQQIESLSLKEKQGGKTVKTGGKIRVEVEAGPIGARSLIFRGDLRYAKSEPEGPDFATMIEGDDGGKSVLGGHVARAFPAGTPVATVVRACAGALGVGTGNLAALEASLRTQGGATFSGGTVLFGPADKELDRVLRSCGYRYSIQNGVLQITQPGKPLTVSAVVLTGGEVPTPTVNPDGTIEVLAPILPELYPGGQVLLQTATKRGQFGIIRVNYAGDSSADGQDWHARLTLKG
jgi:hypothetical protein